MIYLYKLLDLLFDYVFIYPEFPLSIKKFKFKKNVKILEISVFLTHFVKALE